MDQKPRKELVELANGVLKFHFHPGQWRAWESQKRIILVLAGSQGGKTSFGPVWLWQEIKRRGPGDYLIATPTYPLLIKKALPEFQRLFEQQLQLGTYTGSPKHCFTFSEAGAFRTFNQKQDRPTQIFFGHASDPDSLEAATAKAAWLDEAGQKKFKLGSWEAIRRRLSVFEGRVLLTTTPYDLGWLKQKLFDPWEKANRQHPYIDVVRFESIENPAFPRAEYDDARNTMQRWKFDLFYRAIFTRPAGMIYDCFRSEVDEHGRTPHTVPRFAIPRGWRRFLGLDFGGVNTAGIFLAEEPQSRHLFCYREYLAGGRAASDHVHHLLKDEPGERWTPFVVGGSASEGQWRQEFAQFGMSVHEPYIKEVEVGIDRVYGAFLRDELFVFNDLEELLAEIGSYSRELDDMGEPTEKIDAKETYHCLDALRYIVSWIRRYGSSVPDPALLEKIQKEMEQTAPDRLYDPLAGDPDQDELTEDERARGAVADGSDPAFGDEWRPHQQQRRNRFGRRD